METIRLIDCFNPVAVYGFGNGLKDSFSGRRADPRLGRPELVPVRSGARVYGRYDENEIHQDHLYRLCYKMGYDLGQGVRSFFGPV